MNDELRGGTDIRQCFGRRVRELRLREAISQEEFAARCGLDRTYVSGIERGKRNVGLVNIERIAIALNTTVSELFRTNFESN